MNPFFKKLKNLVNLEEESEEKIGEETFPKDLESEESKKPEQPKKKQKRAKKLIIEEKIIENQKELGETDEERKVQEKIEKRKWPEPEGQLTVDVYQTNGELVIQSAIAGIKPEDLDITVQGDTVVIRGKRENIKTTEEKNYFYQECYWGSFSREIILPVEADASRAEATMVEGVLTIRMPKIEREKKRKINIKT